MGYPSYTDYHDLKADFLGQLPINWQCTRLRFTASEPLLYGANEAAVSNDRSLPRYIRITDVASDGTLHEDTFRSLAEKLAAPYLLQEGDILLARSGATVGKSFQYSTTWGKAAYAGYLIRYRTDQKVIFSRFANYYFQTKCYWACIHSTLIQSTIENFSAEKYKELYIPLPEKSEQQKIADFLDWKTARIDSLIAKKKQLIEKLREKRMALITQAVTKGLDPDAPMRDSGIPWLGEVPAHWEVPQLKMRYKVELGKMLDDKRIVGTDLVEYLRNVDVQWDEINFENLPMMDISLTEYQRYTVRENDVLVCEGGEVGRAAIVKKLSGTIGFQKALHRLRATTPNESPRFIFYTLVWAAHTGVYSGEGSSTIAHLTAEQLRRYRFPKPSLVEQIEIASSLDSAISELQQMAKKIDMAITRLTEYRTALITAATTGKIDVRNIRIPKTDKPETTENAS